MRRLPRWARAQSPESRTKGNETMSDTEEAVKPLCVFCGDGPSDEAGKQFQPIGPEEAKQVAHEACAQQNDLGFYTRPIVEAIQKALDAIPEPPQENQGSAATVARAFRDKLRFVLEKGSIPTAAAFLMSYDFQTKNFWMSYPEGDTGLAYMVLGLAHQQVMSKAFQKQAIVDALTKGIPGQRPPKGYRGH